jgi:hypothetical protein
LNKAPNVCDNKTVHQAKAQALAWMLGQFELCKLFVRVTVSDMWSFPSYCRFSKSTSSWLDDSWIEIIICNVTLFQNDSFSMKSLKELARLAVLKQGFGNDECIPVTLREELRCMEEAIRADWPQWLKGATNGSNGIEG